MKDYLKQFLLDCWYAPLWLKLTNGIWLAILVSTFWGGVTWFVDMTENAAPPPDSLYEGVLGMTIVLFPLIMVAVIFALRFAYEWAATKILLHFGFIEESK